MIGHRYEKAIYQSDFYRDCYRKTIKVILFLIVVMLFLIGGIIYELFTQSPQEYYASTTTGQIIPMTAIRR